MRFTELHLVINSCEARIRQERAGGLEVSYTQLKHDIRGRARRVFGCRTNGRTEQDLQMFARGILLDCGCKPMGSEVHELVSVLQRFGTCI